MPLVSTNNTSLPPTSSCPSSVCAPGFLVPEAREAAMNQPPPGGGPPGESSRSLYAHQGVSCEFTRDAAVDLLEGPLQQCTGSFLKYIQGHRVHCSSLCNVVLVLELCGRCSLDWCRGWPGGFACGKVLFVLRCTAVLLLLLLMLMPHRFVLEELEISGGF